MEMSSEHVKEISTALGADLCGIASIDRFKEAPKGFHPCDVLPDCESVIVLVSRFLKSTIFAKSTIPYTDVRNELTRKMDRLAIKTAYKLEAEDVRAVPVNSIGPCEWDAATGKVRGIISLKHAAVLAGLGKIGKNTLLTNNEFGNMIWLSAVLVSARLTADPIAEYEGCVHDCSICLDVCPVNALDGVSMDQKKCWEYAFGKHNGGEWRIKCFACRKACPNRFGINKDKGARDYKFGRKL